MTLPPAARNLFAVLVVVFLLIAVWAGYYAYETAVTPDGPTTNAVAQYSQSATNGFVAALAPSALYNNATHVTGGNITLFPSITTWINVSMAYSLSTNRTVAIATEESFVVALSSSVWQKYLYVNSSSASERSATAFLLTTTYSINVSEVVHLAAEIQSETGYQPASYVLSLEPLIEGTITVGSVTNAFTDAPTLNFTFTGGLIQPRGLSYSASGQVAETIYHPSPGTLAVLLPYLGLVTAVAAAGVTGWLFLRSRSQAPPPLDRLIAPYAEAIAETSTAPNAEVTIPVGQFEDLVKIADTLGKPILHPKEAGPEDQAFMVLDGWLAYSYVYPPAGGDASGGQARATVPVPAFARSAGRLVRRLQSEADRLQGLQLDEATMKDVQRRIRRAIDLVHAKELFEADTEVDEISWILDRAEMRVSRRSPPS